MRRHLRLGIVVATVGVVSIAGTLVARAGWTLPDQTVAAAARAATMPVGVTPRAAIQHGDAVVNWTAQEIVPGVPMSAYLVTAHDTDPRPLEDVVHTVTANGAGTESVVFPGTELAGGKWQFTIIPRHLSWTGSEGRPSNPKLTFAAAAPAALVGDVPVPEATTTAAVTTTPPTKLVPAADEHKPPAQEHAPAADQPPADTATTVPAGIVPDPPTPSATGGTATNTAPTPVPEQDSPIRASATRTN